MGLVNMYVAQLSNSVNVHVGSVNMCVLGRIYIRERILEALQLCVCVCMFV